MFKKIFPKMFTKTKKNKTPKELTIEQCLETEKMPDEYPIQDIDKEIHETIDSIQRMSLDSIWYFRRAEEVAARLQLSLPACKKTLAKFCGRRERPLTAAELQEARNNKDKIAKTISKMISNRYNNIHTEWDLDSALFKEMCRIEDAENQILLRYAKKQREVLLRYRDVKETLRLIEEEPLTQQNRQKIRDLITNLTQIIMQGDIAAGYIKRTVPKNMEEEEEKHFLQCKQNTVNRIARQKIEDYKEGKLDASYETMRQALNLPMRVIDKEHPEIYREWLTEAFKEYIQYLGEKEYEKTRVQKVERYHAVDMYLRLLSKEETEYTEQDKKQIHALICDMHSEIIPNDIKGAYVPREVPECQKEEEKKRFQEYRNNLLAKLILEETENIRKEGLHIDNIVRILKIPFREEDIKENNDACDIAMEYAWRMASIQEHKETAEAYKEHFIRIDEQIIKEKMKNFYREYLKRQGITQEQDIKKKMEIMSKTLEELLLKYRKEWDEEAEPAPEKFGSEPSLVEEVIYPLGWINRIH
ncbi:MULTISPECIES: hypothetical protein [Aminobacterium]|uniref:hypothetical protein n=1 Tax=Aminobacterium TaxID=81466 RepID=UPI00257CD5AF|nr:hypothetical protein [Aminobacterium sp. UBA4834]